MPDARRLKELESENARLKMPLAEAMLENEATREVVQKSGEGIGTLQSGLRSGGSRIE